MFFFSTFSFLRNSSQWGLLTSYLFFVVDCTYGLDQGLSFGYIRLMLYAGILIDVMTGDFYLFSHSQDVFYHISIMLYVMQMQTIMYGNHHTS